MAKIIWVEDEAIKLSGLIRPLKIRHHEIDTAIDMSTAIKMIDKNKYDLILLDIIIPDGKTAKIEDIDPYEGLNVLQHIHQHHNKTPVIILSVVNDNNVIRKIKKMGYNNILSKGTLLPSRLLNTVNNVLRINS